MRKSMSGRRRFEHRRVGGIYDEAMPVHFRLLTRRGLFAGTLLIPHFARAASEPWKQKREGDWSPEEAISLETKSPWAKKVKGAMANANLQPPSMNSQGSRGSFGGMSGADSNGISESGGGGRGGSRGGGGGRGGDSESGGGERPRSMEGPEVVILWESGKPLLEARKRTLPASLNDHYVIGITGVPRPLLMAVARSASASAASVTPAETDAAERQKAVVAALLRAATLAVKGRDVQIADLVLETADRQSILFGFPRQGLPLTVADKNVEFVFKAGAVTFKAKFDLREMMYGGELAV